MESKRLSLALGEVRYQVADVSRSVVFYTERLGFNLDQTEPAGFCASLNRQSETHTERSWCLRLPSDAGWLEARARRLEPDGSSGTRSVGTRLCIEEGGIAFSE